MRLFVAAEPSRRVRQRAGEIAAEVRQALENLAAREIRWIPPENLHVTIWFLGEVPDARSDVVLDALRPALEERAFQLHLSRLGTFPPSASPRVLWMGVSAGAEALARLHGEVGTRLASLGFPPEARSYSAHLTLARIKEPLRRSARDALRETILRVKSDAGRCTVDALTVFRSRTSPTGARYEPLLRVPLS